MNSFDALVVGAGPAGSTIASLLAKAGWSVAIVEKAAFPRKKVCGEYLSATNYQLFKKLGFEENFFQHAGPEIRRVGLFARSFKLTAEMPSADGSWGRALRREILDTMLVEQAVEAGVNVFQPWSVTDITRTNEVFVARLRSKENGEIIEAESRVVIAAHGSWEIGNLPTQQQRQPARESDLLGFKAHFEESRLPADLMPMIIFPGGYGGMVTCDDGLMSISGCIRSDTLREIRKKFQGENIGETLQHHIFESCKGVSESLKDAKRIGDWLTAGVIRPGIRSRSNNGIFVVGNAAGESHPIIAEGISMAIQSSGLLFKALSEVKPANLTASSLDKISSEYDKLWLGAFRKRILSAEIFARLAMSGPSQRVLEPIVRSFPSLLTAGAKLSGKAYRTAI